MSSQRLFFSVFLITLFFFGIIFITESGLSQESISQGESQKISSNNPTHLQATTYYLSPSGNDFNSGTSPTSAWKTISKVNNFTFRPGDRILFEGEATFKGGLSFDSDDSGTSDKRITISSYGKGRATIDAGNATGVSIYNTGGYRISNVNFVGAGLATNVGNGIDFYNELPNDVKLDCIDINNVEVSGFGNYGIVIGGWNNGSGYRNVWVRNVLTHDNGNTGLITYAQTPNVNENVYVAYVQAYNNLGIPGDSKPTGSGIVLGSVNTGVIERSVAHNNGELNDAKSGPVGIWTYDSTNITIQHNESYDNRTGGAVDGGGFDLDQNVSNSVLQYNYSHGNDGAGYLLAHGLENQSFTGNTVRYNISQDDGRKNRSAGIMVYGQIRNTEVYNNTIFLRSASTGNPVAIKIWNPTVENLKVSSLQFRNNIFQTTDGLPVVDVAPSQIDGVSNLLFQGNNYYSTGRAFKISWGTTIYRSLKDWRRATSQEQLLSQNLGFNADPQFVNPGGGSTIGNPDLLHTLDAYRLRSTSPLINAGLDLMTLFGVSPGNQDFYGTAVPQGRSYDVGASELPWSRE